MWSFILALRQPVKLIPKHLLLLLLIVLDIGAVAEVRLVSTAQNESSSLSPNGGSLGAFADDLGNRILFSTAAANLVREKSDSSHFDACLMDVTNRTFTLVSTNLDGRAGTGASIAMGFRGGRSLFLSYAEDLVEDDGNELADIFLRDADGTIRRLGRTSPQTGANAGHATYAAFSGDGSRVVFEIAAGLGADTNGVGGGIYMAETSSGTVTAIATNSPSFTSVPAALQISGDGSTVVFYASETLLRASNVVDLVVARTGRPPFRPNLTPGQPSTISLSQLPIQAFETALSADGRYLAFVTARMPSTAATNAIYWMDLDNPADVRLVRQRVAQGTSIFMSPDGRSLAFDINPSSNTTQVQFWNADTGIGGFDSFLTTVPPASTEPANSTAAVLSPDGSRVLFMTDASVSTPVSTNILSRVALRVLATGETRFLSDLPDGTPAPEVGIREYQFLPDGSVLLATPAPLVAGDLNSEYDIFLFPSSGEPPRILTRKDASLIGGSANNASQIDDRCLSADGRFLVFSSFASNLVPGDTNRTRDIFLKDLRSGTISLVSVSTNGGSANSVSSFPKITPDGRFVVFLSAATDLAPGDSNRLDDAYLRDLQTGTTILLSTRLPVNPALAASITAAAINDSGTLAVLESTSRDLVPESFVTSSQVFIRNIAANTTLRISKPVENGLNITSGSRSAMTPDGRFVAFLTGGGPVLYEVESAIASSLLPDGASGPANSVTISPDGGRFATQIGADIWIGARHPVSARRLIQGVVPVRSLAFTPDGSRLIVSTSNESATNIAGVFFLSADVQGTDSGFELISVSTAGQNGNGVSDQPSVSADGRFVVFRSTATNLVPEDDGLWFHDLFVRDVVEHRTVRLVSNPDERLFRPTISNDGRLVVFNSFASTLVSNDRNGFADVFVADVRFPALLRVAIAREGASSVLSFATVAENRYQLERRASLTAGVWIAEGEPFNGDGSDRRIVLDAGDPSAAFFRITAQPR